MNNSYLAGRYGDCVWEMQVRQRLAPVEAHTKPPMWLGYVWMTAYLGFLGSYNLTFSVNCVWTVILIWNALLVAFSIWAGGALILEIVRSYSPQMGEMDDKSARRLKFLKNRNSVIRERVRTSVKQLSSGTKGSKESSNTGRRKKEKFKEQINTVAITEAFNNFASIHGVPISDAVLNRIENLGALFLAVKDCVTVTGFLSTIFLYLKTHYTKSVANLVIGYLCEMLDADFNPQSGEIGVDSAKDKPKWLLLLKDLQENWSLVIRNDGFKKISHVLSLCLALGLCDSSSLDFQVGGMKMFSIGAFPKHVTAVDLIDAAFETVVYFTEGGYMCFERGSVKPLLYGNMDNEEFEEAYSKCLRCHEYAKCGNLEKFEDMSENDYDALLAQCIEKAQILKTTCKGIVEKNIMSRKVDILRQWQATFRQTRVQGGLRESPYSIGIFGGTAVGKSAIANALMVTTLKMNGYSATDDRIVTLNESDKFMSNFRSYTNGVLVDDIGNTKSEFVERAPTALMIQLVNNVRMYANMAEADMKGKVSVEPKVVIGTKNVKDTCASTYSNEPASITRRDRITLTCKVKPEYAVHDMLNEDKVRDHFPYGTPCIPDFWNITAERSFPIPHNVRGKAARVGWEVIMHNGVPLQDVSLPFLIAWIEQDSKKFFKNQKEFVDKNNNLDGRIALCSTCNLPIPDVCYCQEVTPFPNFRRLRDDCPEEGFCRTCLAFHDEEDDEDSIYEGLSELFDEQLGEILVAAFLPRFRFAEKWFAQKCSYWTEKIERKTVDVIMSRLVWLEKSPWVSWTNWIPDEWIKKEWMKNVVWFTHEVELRKRIRVAYRNHLLILLSVVLLTHFVSLWFWVLVFHPLFGISGVVKFEKERLYNEIVVRRDTLSETMKKYRESHVKWITSACLAIGALYAIAQIYKVLRVIPTPQGNLAPKSATDIVERDLEVNPWAGAVVSQMPCSEKSKTTVPDRLEKMVQDNLCHMSISLLDGGTRRFFECDAFFPKSNVAIVPQHMWKSHDIKATFTRHSPDLIGGNFECFLYRKYSVDVPGTDLCIVWVPNGGDWKDLTEYLPLDRFASVPARLTYKKKDGDCVTSKLMMDVGEVVTYAAEFFGATYKLSFETFEGLCIAPIITETKGPLIGGFHLGGKNGTVRGCSGLLLKSQFDVAFESLRRISGVVLSKSSGEIPKELYDIQFFENDEIHFKSPINYLPHGTNCRYYGQVKGRASYHSSVVPTVISPLVDEVCGVPQQWGGPKFRSGWPWQASLQYSTKPSCGIEGSLLDRAARDYIGGLRRAIREIPELMESMRPLTQMETICGIDGLRFIDKMPPSTSIGYPLSGPKSNYLTYLDPNEVTSHQCPAELDSIFWDHAKEMEDLYLQGKRAYPIFKACLKDEPTKLTKDKVRVFQGAPVALQLLVRKYFLPIARTLSMLPLVSECAVGINAQGPEWDQLAHHVKKYGDDRILAGDYSKYDLRMPAQVMFVAFRILMDLARDAGYVERDLIVMEGIATDICYPLMAYNGDLIQHYGSNPSGQNLTVYINSIVNALLFRCAYFHVTRHRTDVPEFRAVCALITYGDDAKSSVRDDFPEFNHLTVATFLEEHDMKFTMPDKESTPVPYMTDCEADLLKRANVFCEDTGMIMGALDEDSIFKSLHSTLKSGALTREQQSMQNIDGGLREWFFHGRTIYEERRQQMLEIAERAGLSHGCTVIHETYEERLKSWKDKYK